MIKNLRIFISLMPIIALLLAPAPGRPRFWPRRVWSSRPRATSPYLYPQTAQRGWMECVLISRLPEQRT
jgi:hypothetical protein